MRVYVARHGETTWNVEGRYQGRRESDLSPLGMRQAYALGEAAAALGLQRVVSSPLRRCVESASPSAERLGLALETDDTLIEIAHGTWEGRLRDEIAANDPERYRAWRSDPAHVAFDGGETVAQVQERWLAFARRPVSAPTLVVTHDAVVRVALLAATARPLDAFWDVRVENAGYAVFESGARGWSVVDECVVGHLGRLRAATEGQAL